MKVIIDSTNIKEVEYFPETSTLTVVFKNGSVYDYLDVSVQDYISLLYSSSKGKHFAEHIRTKKKFVKK